MAKTVMAFGSFDILHPGHILYLQKAKRLGDRLIVVVARDRSIEMFKKKRPVFSERERAAMVGSLAVVDRAVLGNNLSGPEGRLKIIRKYRPDVIAFGYDQRIDQKEVGKWLKSNGIKARIVRIKSVADERRYKSSAIRRKIMQ
ncbi:MAG TPA: adenylyltransferase/cytidyltransferase family protein [Candidatus Saccharimonadales bacterium]|nr:adenylyltransferase/cytidyltransferase family protein [Candidatus Saccharimonadales bacterium]